MALIGDYTKYTYSQHETNTVDVDVTNPDTGASETITIPETVVSTEIIPNAYVVITNYNFTPLHKNDNDESSLDFQYRVYESKSARNSDPNTFLEEENILGRWHNLDSTEDLRQKCYSILKEEQSCINLIDN